MPDVCTVITALEQPLAPATSTLWPVLEGTSQGQRGQAALQLTAPATATATVTSLDEPSARPTEPPHEIWFKRRISLATAAHELWQFRELVLTLAERDLRVRYKQAALGVAWAVFTPVVTMIAFTLLFTKVTNSKLGDPGVPYALFSYLGLLPWTYFSTALATGGLSLVSNVPLLNKLYCPREVFPIAAMIDAAFDTVIACLVLLALFPIVGYAPRIDSFYVPLLIIPLVLCTAAFTLFTSSVVVFMRDLRLVLPILIQIGMFATPVIWSTDKLSKIELVAYSAINPLVAVIDGLRRTVLHGQQPHWLALGLATVSSIVMLVIGFVVFKRLETGIADVA